MRIRHFVIIEPVQIHAVYASAATLLLQINSTQFLVREVFIVFLENLSQSRQVQVDKINELEEIFRKISVRIGGSLEVTPGI